MENPQTAAQINAPQTGTVEVPPVPPVAVVPPQPDKSAQEIPSGQAMLERDEFKRQLDQAHQQIEDLQEQVERLNRWPTRTEFQAAIKAMPYEQLSQVYSDGEYIRGLVNFRWADPNDNPPVPTKPPTKA